MKGKIGPYEISERLGTGGMGEVFKASDRRLGRDVAIKRIRPGKEDTDENRERFRREAQATAQLNHASIVHVYDIFRDGDSDCIVMEFVEGRTLQSRLTEGPLEPHEAAEMGREIAEGLAVAHDKGILHRDLKTENIMLTPRGHAKILDFGLAKRPLINELDDSLTGKGQLVGTSRTMSPEYVSGDSIDHRSDLFSLGVLLYEAVTGHSPFKAQNTLATLKQVIVHQQPPAQELNPAVPEDLSDLLDRMLEKAPDDRPQSASEVAAELGRVSGQLSSGTFTRSPSSSSGHGMAAASSGEWTISTTVVDPRLRRYLVGLLVVILAALAGAYILGKRSKPIPPADPSKRALVVLGDFQNLTGDSLLDKSLKLAFQIGLEQSRHINIMSEKQIEDVLSRMQRSPATTVDRDLGVEICQREGAQALVIGSIVRVGSSYSLSAQIVDSLDQNLFTTDGTASAQGEILEVLQRIVQDLRTEFGESLAAIESSPPLDKVTTSDLQALKLYYFGAEEQAKGSLEDAISSLERALERDPQFAMAHAKIGVAYQALGRSEKVLYHFNEASKYSDRLSPSEKLYIDGWLANSLGTTDEMVSSWRLMITLYPDKPSGYHNLGMVHYQYRNQFSEAATTFRSGLLYMDPQRQRVLAYPLGLCELALGNYPEAASAFQEGGIISGLADVQAAQGRHSEAQATIEEEESLFGKLLSRTHYYVDQGQFSQARSLLREVIALADQQNSAAHMLTARMTLITALRTGGDSDELGPVLEESFEKASVIFHDDSVIRVLTPIPFLATLGKIRARTSSVDQSDVIYNLIREKAEASGIRLWVGYLRMLEGEILMAKGRESEAISLFEEAVNFEGPFQAHESLAYALESHGDTMQAIERNLWIAGQRGRAFAECLLVCGVRSQNIVDWNIALWRLGRLYEASGQPNEAEKYYRQLAERWSNGDAIPLLKETAARLLDLEGR